MDRHYDELASEWNMAAAYLRSLRECLDMMNAAAFNSDWHGYYKAIDTLKRELLPKMHAEKRKDEEESEREKIAGLMKRAYNAIATGMDEMEIYRRLTAADEFLRDILEKRKLLTPQAMNPGSALAADKSY